MATRKKAKSTRKRGSQKNDGNARPRRRAPRQVMGGLDEAGMAYANLLLDPCFGPLVHPLYPGASSGLLTRSDKTFDVNGASGTAGVIHLCPGATGLAAEQIKWGSALTSSATITLANAGAAGEAFLSTNAVSCRPVAACLQLVYTGTEQNRAGLVYMGHTDGEYLNSGTITADSCTNALPYYGRMPNDVVEIMWKPTDRDATFESLLGTSNLEGRGAVTIAWTGVNPSAFLRIRIVIVWEYRANKTNGIIDDGAYRNLSRNTWADVINSIEKAGHKWYRIGVDTMTRNPERFAGMAVDAALAFNSRRALDGISRRFPSLSIY